MLYEKKFFGAGAGNFDDADFAVELNQWTNMENCRVGSTDFPTGAIGYVEEVGSNVLITSALPSSQNYCNGGVYDQARNRIIYLLWNSLGFHQIRVFDIGAQTIYVALYSSQVEPDGLNFDKNHFIHSARVVNGALYWVDGTQNQPRYINIDAAIKMNYPLYVTDQQPYTSPLSFSEITIIKPPPIFPPNIQKNTDSSSAASTDVSAVSFIANESYSFAFEYVYYTNETTVIGSYSVASRLNKVTDTFNRIIVTMDAGEVIPNSVRMVNLIVRIGNTASRIKTWDKEVADEASEIADQNNATNVLTFFFYGSRGGEAVEQSKILKPFDSVPIYSETLESAKNRNFLGSNTEGYDAPLKTPLSYYKTYVSVFGSGGDLNKQLILVGLAWAFPVFGRSYGAWMVFLTEVSPAGYYAITTSETFENDFTPPVPPSPGGTVAFTGLTFRGATQADVIANIKAQSGAIGDTVVNDWTFTGDNITITGLAVDTFDIFKTSAQYQLGVVYYDFAMRKCGVVTNPSLLVNTYQRSFAFNFNPTNAIVWDISSEWTADRVARGLTEAINDTSSEDWNSAGGAPATGTTGFPPTAYDSTGTDRRLFIRMNDGDNASASADANGQGNTPTITQISNVTGSGFRDIIYEIGTDVLPGNMFVVNIYGHDVRFTVPEEIPNTEAIPEWAYYYSIVRTLNLRTRFFIQAFDDAPKYATKDADGAYEFTSDTFVTGTVGIGIDTAALVQAGLGYVFAEGDVCVIYSDAGLESYELPVIGQSGNYIIVKAFDLGDLSTQTIVYEIYTPYVQTDIEPFYEVGNMYRILNPGTGSREHEVLTDILAPDSYVLTRNFNSVTYLAETMSPNDLYYKRWDNDGGKLNIITKVGQQVKENSISYSDTFIAGTSVNGLSTFEALNEKPLPVECGAIKKLQLTAKVSEQGSVMLAICERETASLYLGEVQVVGSSSNAFLAQSQDVIGTINILKGSYGTANPESVIEYRGNVYWFDRDNGRFAQYSLNGLFPISNYKCTRFWKLFAEQYAAMSASDIEALGSRPYVFSGIDPHNNELLVSIPKLSNTPPRGFLPDYPSVIYPFDILDFQAKSMVYRLDREPNFWQGSYSIPAEMFISAQNELYSFKDGSLYLHNDETSFSNFYGVQNKPRIMFLSNQVPNRPKSYNSAAIESNKVPTFVYFYTEYPYAQSSDLVDFDFEVREGTFYAPIYRNKLVPTATGMLTTGLLTAEKMRSIALRVLIEFNSSSVPMQLRFITLGYSLSLGHTT